MCILKIITSIRNLQRLTEITSMTGFRLKYSQVDVDVEVAETFVNFGIITAMKLHLNAFVVFKSIWELYPN